MRKEKLRKANTRTGKGNWNCLRGRVKRKESRRKDLGETVDGGGYQPGALVIVGLSDTGHDQRGDQQESVLGRPQTSGGPTAQRRSGTRPSSVTRRGATVDGRPQW